MLLKELVDKNRVCFHQGFHHWEDAVRAAAKPLVEDGSILSTYVDAIIENVHKFGPYIVLAPKIAMPHCQQNAAGVVHTAVSFMKLEAPVHFEEGNPDKDAYLFFVLASENPDLHMKNMQELALVLLNPEIVEELMDVHSTDDLLKLDKKYTQ